MASLGFNVEHSGTRPSLLGFILEPVLLSNKARLGRRFRKQRQLVIRVAAAGR
jgi:hypothetical protein